jgi:sodium/potassium-transporting ATPase subunit beta
MSHNQSTNPKIVKRSTKGSVVSTTYEFPLDRKKNQRTLKEIIYDRENGKVLGRTPKNWGELLLFYAIFYIALAALFAICMEAMMATIDEKEPKWKLEESIIGTNPGLGFRPISDDTDQGSLIWYDSTNQSQILHWTHNLDRFLEEYKKSHGNQKNCDFEIVPTHNQTCRLDLGTFGDCSPENAYGYNNSAPCIFLKLNKIFNWIPEYYNDTEKLPSDMPEDLVKYIKSLEKEQRNQIWVSCRGEDPSDQEIAGEVQYFPSRGFPSYFYPFKNYEGYVSPLVAVKFIRPKVNQIINVECRSWAKNIEYSGSKRDRKGSVHFEIMIDAHVKQN